MQLKKIAKICAATKTIVTYNHIDTVTGAVRQFVGDRFALYETGNLGDNITLEIVQTIFDVKKEDRPKWTWLDKQFNPRIARLLEDTCPEEIPLNAYDIRICYRGAELIPFYGGGKLFFIEEAYMTPLRDEIKQGGIGVFWREGHNIVTVKNGMCQAIACISTVELPETVVLTLHDIDTLLTSQTNEETGAEAGQESNNTDVSELRG